MRRATASGPVKVVLVEMHAPVRGIEAVRSDGVRYPAARVIVLRDGRPVGERTVPLPDCGLTPAQVSAFLAAVAADAGPEDERYHGAEWPRVSVVVATDLTRPDALTRCLSALAGQDYPDFEVIVVDNRPGRAGGAGAIRPEWTLDARIRFVAEPRPGASAARNRGLAEADGEIVAFTDDDTSADSRWLRALVQRFLVEPDADCVTGMVLPGELETPAQIWFEASRSAFRPYYRRASFGGEAPFTVFDRLAADPDRARPVYRFARYGTGCNMAVRARMLRSLGGFDPALGPGTPAGAGEDLLVFLRLLSSGGRLAYEPAAVIRHWHRRDLPALSRQLRNYGKGFTAMLVAAIRTDPSHAWGLTRMLARMGWRGDRADASSTVSLPARLFWDRRLGDVCGPIAYLAGRRRIRKWPS